MYKNIVDKTSQELFQYIRETNELPDHIKPDVVDALGSMISCMHRYLGSMVLLYQREQKQSNKVMQPTQKAGG
uniref:Uncharacterized protein n=1 Tax=viral metagenome TaxID=1070528 RepID=A0A6M3LXQ0_9ZZZZ